MEGKEREVWQGKMEVMNSREEATAKKEGCEAGREEPIHYTQAKEVELNKIKITKNNEER